ncbi:MAG TPA: ribose-phosphate pyrophosphokinase, partial [Clostridia bacterium]|nr:ribose-phosphate pyrophosphokinase [Clostridia bacterium]
LGAQAILDRGAQEVYACCTHPVFSGDAVARLEASVLKEVVVTNTIPVPSSRCKGTKIKVLSVARLLGEAILRIHEDRSVSELFR